MHDNLAEALGDVVVCIMSRADGKVTILELDTITTEAGQ